MGPYSVIELLAHASELAGKIPDSPRLGRKLLLIGSALVCVVFVPEQSAQWGVAILIAKSLIVITGAVLLIPGTLIFFRRWVWKRQEKRAPVVTSLRLK